MIEDHQGEMTIHMDYLFGEGTLPDEDSGNQASLGFSPLAAIAPENEVVTDHGNLKAYLSETDYDTLSNALKGIGHVGEGHCTPTELKQ